MKRVRNKKREVLRKTSYAEAFTMYVYANDVRVSEGFVQFLDEDGKVKSMIRAEDVLEVG